MKVFKTFTSLKQRLVNHHRKSLQSDDTNKFACSHNDLLPNSSSRTWNFLTRITLLLQCFGKNLLLSRKFHRLEKKLTNDSPLKEQPRKKMLKDYGNLLVSHLFVIIELECQIIKKYIIKIREVTSRLVFSFGLFAYVAVKWKPNVYLIVEQFLWWKKFAARFQFSLTNNLQQREASQVYNWFFWSLFANWNSQKISLCLL